LGLNLLHYGNSHKIYRLWLRVSKALGQCRKPTAHATVKDIAADLDAQPAYESGVLNESSVEPRAVHPLEAVLQLGPQFRRQAKGALDICGV
jgi:hypothetical protein